MQFRQAFSQRERIAARQTAARRTAARRPAPGARRRRLGLPGGGRTGGRVRQRQILEADDAPVGGEDRRLAGALPLLERFLAGWNRGNSFERRGPV